MAQLNGTGIARRQRLIGSALSSFPNRSDGMDHMPRRQPITLRDFSVAGLAAMERSAFHQQLRPGRPVDRTIDTPAAKQRGVGGVDDGVNAQSRDVGDDNLDARVADLARRQNQGESLRRRQPR